MSRLVLSSVAVCLLCAVSASADEQLRRVQEELRKRNLYFGEVDGRRTGETAGAIRRYQERIGFPPTGTLTPETLQSLEITPPKQPGEEWPDGPVLRSDSARQLAENDRKFLETIASATPPATGEPTPSEREVEPPPSEREPEPSPATPPLQRQPEAPPAPVPQREAEPAPEEPEPPAAPPPGREPREPGPTITVRPRAIPAPAPSRISRAPGATPAPSARVPKLPPIADAPASDLEERTRQFVLAYLEACETNRLDQELGFYAQRVSYFDHGRVDRNFVARDVERFYQRWPQRAYELLDFKVSKVEGADAEVSFRIGFRYKNGSKRVEGRSANYFKVRREGDRMYFTSLKEQRVRD
jgi:peptidoglycan hydrolase-like protein with peptidoglycan-binding domain